MNTRLAILRVLADGELHSGEVIGRRLGISRAAVSKGVRRLAANGLRVSAAAGIGYRLGAPLVPLDARRIQRNLVGTNVPAPRVEILEQVDSTNRHLFAAAITDPDPGGMVCLAEVQPQGRGRRGKSWVATPYENLLLSMAWRFHVGPAMVAGLSLAAGVAVVRALEGYGVTGCGLKWPNDILWCSAATPGGEERKLAGLLVEVHGEASGPCTTVLGVGVNCCIAQQEARRIDQPWTDLHTITGETTDRNRLAALIIEQLYTMYNTFAHSGLAAFRQDWERRHLHAHRPVRVSLNGTAFEGTIEGIDGNGALRVCDERGATRVFHSGEVSLRSMA